MMVRKDVKIGAVVVGILITVLIVYVLVVPGGDRATVSDAALPLSDEQLKDQLIQTENVVAEIGRSPVPAASNQPATVPPTAPVVADAGRTDPFGPADEKWMMALNTGNIPGRVQPAPGSAIVNNPANTSPAARPMDSTVAPNAAVAIDTRATSPRTHVVQPGESLARIAENVYGSQVYYKDIMAANPTIKPEKLRPGMVITLPDVKEVKGKGNVDDDSPAPAIDSRLEYRVQPGDSMHKIAARLYGKPEMWEDIYDLNRDKIGSDPAKLKVGMILKLPKPPTAR